MRPCDSIDGVVSLDDPTAEPKPPGHDTVEPGEMISFSWAGHHLAAQHFYAPFLCNGAPAPSSTSYIF